MDPVLLLSSLLCALLVLLFAGGFCGALYCVLATRRMLDMVRSDYADLWRQHGSPLPLRFNPFRGFIDSFREVMLAHAAATTLSSDDRIAALAKARRKGARIILGFCAALIVAAGIGFGLAFAFQHAR